MNSIGFSMSPKNVSELLKRENQLAGHNFATLVATFNLTVPINFKNNKEWVGMLLEIHLGVNGLKAQQDFAHLGIEFKTIPVNRKGNPLQSTFVCIAALSNNIGLTWEYSYIKRRLEKILWIPGEADHNLPISKRRVGASLLWQLDSSIGTKNTSRLGGNYGK